jgi:glycosyltransferase involved in cell wall biosynthesis
MPFISIVVPIYNTEKYLSKCINSLIKQTFSDIEIILVNDGSPDNSIEIMRKYEKLDNRIIVIDKANAGVSAARNVGI